MNFPAKMQLMITLQAKKNHDFILSLSEKCSFAKAADGCQIDSPPAFFRVKGIKYI